MHLPHSNFLYFPLLDKKAAAAGGCSDLQDNAGSIWENLAVLDAKDVDEIESRIGEEAELDALLDRMLDIQACTGSYGGGESSYQQAYQQSQEQCSRQPVVSFSTSQWTSGEQEQSSDHAMHTGQRTFQSSGQEQEHQQQQPQLRSNVPCAFGSPFYPVPSAGYYQYGTPNYDPTAALISFAAPPPPQPVQLGGTGFGTEQASAAIRPISAAALHRQKLFQLGRTVSSPEMPTPPIAPPASVAPNQSLSSSTSSLCFPMTNSQLSQSLPCVDRTVAGAGRFPWTVDPYHSSLLLPQHSGSPSPSHSDSRSPPDSATITGPSIPLSSPFGETSFVFHSHSVASPREPTGAQHMLCAVCMDIAACQHYGVRTCEGCKGFFKRTVQKNAKYVCLANRDCVIDKRRRNRCQYCRFQKCLAMGMVKEVVRTDSLKGRRGRLPSKSKLPIEEGVGTSGGSSQLQPMTKALVQAFMASGECGQSVRQGHQEQFVDSVRAGLAAIHGIVEKIPGWNNIDERDRATLLRQSALYALTLRLANRSISVASDQKLLTDDGLVYTEEECPAGWRPWFQSVLSLSIQFRESLELDITAFCCMCSLSLFQEHTGMYKVEEVDKLKNSLINCLKEHCTYSPEAKTKPQYFAKIISKLAELHTICHYAKEAYAATIDTKYTPGPSSSLTTASFYDESFMN